MSETLSTVRTQLSIYLDDNNADVTDNIWSNTQKNHAINAAIRSAYPSWFTEATSSDGNSDWVVVCDARLEYTLPTMRRLLGVSVEVSDEYVTGDVSSITSASLTGDSVSWTTNEYYGALSGSLYGYHVVIYDADDLYDYIKGYYAPIITNSSDTLGVTGTGYNWASTTITPTGAKFMIKQLNERTRDWRKITSYRTNKFESPTRLYLTAQYIAGMYLQLHYLTVPAEMDDDADTTDVPMQWLIHQAAANLQIQRMRKEPGFENKTTTDLFTIDQNLADDYREKHAMRFPSYMIQTERETGYAAWPDEYPL